MATMTRKDAEALIVGKAESDPEFRKELIEDPKAVIVRELGISLPQDFEVSVFEETDKRSYLVLPPLRAASGELSEGDLDQVAGGTANAAGKGRPTQAVPGTRVEPVASVAVKTSIKT